MARFAEERECLCGGQWLKLALETLHNNGIERNDFAASVIAALEGGRKKGTNLFIKGEGNCGKSFLFYPLKEIFDCFSNPPSSTFNWIGVEKSEVIFLNDFRWTPTILPLSQLLQPLEGDEVNFPTPKNHWQKNIHFVRDSPVFATSSDEIISNKIGPLMLKETKMMRLRWKVYAFTHEIPEDKVCEQKPCGVCFTKLIYDPEHFF